MKNLSQKECQSLIPILNSKLSFNLFDSEKSYLELKELSFFRNYHLIVAGTFSTIPPVTMEYLWNMTNNDVIKLDGTRDCVFDNLEKLEICITDNNVIDYLKFVLGCIQSEQGTLRLVQDITDVEYSQSPTQDEIVFLTENIKPAKVEIDDETCAITCNVIYGDALYVANIELFIDGTFEFISEQKLKNGLPIRQIFLE